MFECGVDSSDWTVTWYINGAELPLDDEVLSTLKDNSLLNVTVAEKGYGGRYSCKAQSKSRGVKSDSSNTVEIKVYGELSSL